MLLAARAESQMLPIRRPLRLALFTAQLGQLPRRFVARDDGRNPKVMLGAHPDHPLTIGRELYVLAILFIAAHVADQPRLARLHVRRPHLLLGFFDLAGWIGHMAFAVHFRAAGIDHGLAIGRKLHGKDVLAIVALIVRYLAAGKFRRIRNPDIAFALAVEHPGNAIGLVCRGQRRGKRRAHHLFQREAGFLRQTRSRDQNEEEKKG